MSAELAGQAYVEMSVKGREDFAKAFAEMQASVRTFAAKLNNVKMAPDSSRLKKFFSSATRGFKDLTASAMKYGSIAGAALGAGAIAVLSDAVHKASDLQEVMNKFKVVFGSNATAMEAWGDTFAQQMGRSKKQTMEFLANAQGLVIPMGVDPAQAEGMSKSLTQLAYDLASFHNATDADAFDALKSAITGESEPMKKFGVIVNETAVKAELLKHSLKPETATEAQKAMARYNIILEGTTQAQGDVERSGDSFANRLKALQAVWDDLAAGIGTNFLPIAEALIGWLKELVQSLGGAEGASDTTSQALDQLGGSTAVVENVVGFFVKAWAGVDLALNTTMGILREMMRTMLDLFKLMVNNPLAKGVFGEQAIDDLVTIIDAVEESTAKLSQANRERAGNAFESLMDPRSGANALDSIEEFTRQAKEKYRKQAEALKEARKASGEGSLKTIGDLGSAGGSETAAKKAEALAMKKRKSEIQIEMDNLRSQTETPAKLENLDRTSTEAYKRFQENQWNAQKLITTKQLKELEKVRKALEDDKLGIVEIE
jgi:hypothetical protein